MKNFVVGAQLYSVRSLCQDAATFDTTLAAIKAMGYNTVQISGVSREIPDEVVADLLKKYALKCVVTHNPMQEFENELPQLIARHKLWDCEYAGLGAMPGEYHEDVEGFKRFAAKANEIGAKLKDEGIKFVYHNHAFEFARYDGVLGMDVLFDEFSENVQFELDSYWVQAGGASPEKWFRKVDGRMEVAHFKDMRGTPNFNPPQTMVPVGSGNIDFLALKQICEETAVRYAEVEQDNASMMDKPLSQMEESANNLKKLGFIL